MSTQVEYHRVNKQKRGGAHVADTGTQEGGLPRPVSVFNQRGYCAECNYFLTRPPAASWQIRKLCLRFVYATWVW